MTSLKNLVRAAQESLPITIRHSNWLELNSNAVYSQEALKFAADALAHDVGGARKRGKRLFRASSTGQCARKRVFGFLGAPEKEGQDGKLSNIFHTGNFLHLKWQMAGLTEGWLSQAEVPVESDKYLLGGTMDGILYDGSGFEFKTINSNGFRGVMDYGPKKDHILQVHAYMAMTDIDRFSIVYENKDTGEWREFGVRKDADLLGAVIDQIVELESALEKEELPRELEPCKSREGFEFRYCQYSEICAKATFEEYRGRPQ